MFYKASFEINLPIKHQQIYWIQVLVILFRYRYIVRKICWFSNKMFFLNK